MFSLTFWHLRMDMGCILCIYVDDAGAWQSRVDLLGQLDVRVRAIVYTFTVQ